MIYVRHNRFYLGILREWAISDCFKAITAQQKAAKVYIGRAIWRRIPIANQEQQRKSWLAQQLSQLSKKANIADKESLWNEALLVFPVTEEENDRKYLFDLLYNNPTKNNWLHKTFRNLYVPGHTYVRNQIVYQSQGYKATRLKRNLIQIDVQGLKRGKKIT